MIVLCQYPLVEPTLRACRTRSEDVSEVTNAPCVSFRVFDAMEIKRRLALS